MNTEQQDLFARSFADLTRITDPTRGGENPDDPQTVQAMPLVLHLEKRQPPARQDVLADAAKATLACCFAPEIQADPQLRRALYRWYDARMRKIARRARASHWDKVQALPGATVGLVRAFVPCPVVDTPAAINSLQIQGTDLAKDNNPQDLPQGIVLAVDDSLGMSAGKAAAQVAHAAMLGAVAQGLEFCRQWQERGWQLAVRELPHEDFVALAAQPQAAVVQDAGYTEVAPGAYTALFTIVGASPWA